MEAATKPPVEMQYAASASGPRSLEDEEKEEAYPDVSSGSSLLNAPVHWGAQRVYGHEIAPGIEPELTAHLQGAVHAAKVDRRKRKLQIAQQVYEHRAQFRPDAERKDLAKTPEGKAFLTRFGMGGAYDVQNASAQITSDHIIHHLKGRGLKDVEAHDDPENQQTHVLHGGKRVMTLHRGRSAFIPGPEPTADLPRQMMRKHGSQKDYVVDDRGVPTRRYGYAIKDSDQIGILNGGQTLRGRFISRLQRPSVMEATPRERAELGETADQLAHRPVATHSENDMLFMHQEFGSNDRQRGVSIASTASPLLSNEGRGFAKPNDQGARKLKIDLARVPPRQQDAPPNLINFYHRIPGFEAQRVTPPALHWTTQDPLKPGDPPPQNVPLGADPHRPAKFSAEQGAQRWAWSTGKNRELFLRELSPGFISGRARPSTLERTHYDPRAVPEEYEAAKTEPYRSEQDLAMQPPRLPAHVLGPLLSVEQEQRAKRDAEKKKRGEQKRLEHLQKVEQEKLKHAPEKKPGPDNDEDDDPGIST